MNLLSTTSRDIILLLDNGTITSLQIVQEYRRRIKRDNPSGFWLNPIIELAPEDVVLEIAFKRDRERLRKTLKAHYIAFLFCCQSTI